MSLAQDLLRQAEQLAGLDSGRPRQANLRRAISAAYYALFHLLIDDFVANWELEHQRVRLGRMFEHRKMREATFKAVNKSAPTPIESDLLKVIGTFVRLQDDRYAADYDIAKVWSRSDVMTSLALAEQAFKSWRNIRKDKIAQDHLLSMFGARRS